ncbi:MAG: hypothetical protein PHU85_19110, partial [Phycisphaerae bacterium]|nr:hypothetical protein [Phycisphaerae bacterium]
LTQVLAGSTFIFDSVTVGQVTSVSGEILSRNAPDFGDCDKDVRVRKVGTFAYGAMTITAVYDPTGTTGSFTTLKTKAAARTVGTAKFTFEDGSYLESTSAAITNLSLPTAGGEEDRVMMTLTVRPVTDGGTAGAWALTTLAAEVP